MGVILNWIVQGVMVAAAAGIGLSLLPAGRARARVQVWWTVVGVVIALPLVSWWSATALTGASNADGVASGVIAPLVVVPHSLWNATAVAAALWMGWICLQSLRLFLDLRALARARRACLPVSPSVESRLRPSTRARLAKSLARLAVSGDVRAAAVLGFAPPIIAIQPALLLHLTDAELDQVVIHEWAHVARRDGLGTLVQQVVHALVGWHPAVWFAMSRVRMEREMACDEVVVDATGSAKAYASCLTRVAALAQTSRGSRLAVAMLSSPGLTRRVLRLLAIRRAPAFAPHLMMIPAALAVVVAVGSGQLRVFGVQIMPLALVEARIVSATPSNVARIANPLPPAWTPKPASIPAAARDVTGAAEARPEGGSEAGLKTGGYVSPKTGGYVSPKTAGYGQAGTAQKADTAQQAATIPAVGQIEEPAPMPLASSTVPAAVSQPPGAIPETSAPESSAERTTVSGEARQAWAAATQAGESIGLGSRRGAVATAGFFTRLGKKVATSF